MIVFAIENLSATGRDAAQEFAETFKPSRMVVWHIDGKFHFEGGLKTYRIRSVPRGFEIVDDFDERTYL